MSVLAPSPPDLHKKALVKRIVDVGDKDGDSKLDSEEIRVLFRLVARDEDSHWDSDKQWRRDYSEMGTSAEDMLQRLPGYWVLGMACKLVGARKLSEEAAVQCGALDRLDLPEEGTDFVSPIVTSAKVSRSFVDDMMKGDGCNASRTTKLYQRLQSSLAVIVASRDTWTPGLVTPVSALVVAVLAVAAVATRHCGHHRSSGAVVHGPLSHQPLAFSDHNVGEAGLDPPFPWASRHVGCA